MKLKYYLRGLGIGVIVTTLILMIAFSLHRGDGLTDEEIVARAKELGMVMQEAEKPVKDTLANSGDDKDNTESEQPEKLPAPSQNHDEKKPQESLDEQGLSTSDEIDRENTPQKETVERVELTIVGGEYSDKVSEKLEKAGLIDDAESFNKYLAECKMDSFIQPGNYTLTVGASYDEIIEEITKKD